MEIQSDFRDLLELFHRYKGKYGDIPVNFIGCDQFISNKRAIGRKKDLADLEMLGEESHVTEITRTCPYQKPDRVFPRKGCLWQ